MHRIVITGSGGFVGKRVCKVLANEGFTLVLLTRNPTENGLKWSLDASVEETASYLMGASTIVHLAAYLPSNYENLDEAQLCFESNALGTLNLLRAARLAGIKHFIHASSAAIYTPSAEPASETSGTIPCRATPYLASKLAAEVFISGIGFNEKITTTILRLASVYGPGMSVGGLVPTCVRQLNATGKFMVADGNRYVTDLVHVDDVAATILKVVTARVGGTFNIASGKSTTPLDVAKTSADLLGILNADIQVAPPISGKPTPTYTSLSIYKAQNELDFNPIGLRGGLSSYIESLF